MNRELKKTTLDFIEENGFKELTDVQKKCLEYAGSGKDVVTIARTGTGKTHAYLIPVCEMINTKSDKTQVLISLPTRELAYQVYQNTLVMKKVMPDLRVSLLSGGTDKKRSLEKLSNPPHIIIGTPGRIKDVFVSNAIRVDFVQMFIIDEADMTLDYGFLEDIDAVFSHMVKDPEVLCFSATFPNELKVFVRKYLTSPKIIEVEDEKRNPQISHVLVPCKHLDYHEKLLQILPGFDPYVCLIFAGSKDDADKTHEYLEENGYKNLLIHGGLPSRTRLQAVKSLKRGDYRYVVASDVASRGIDIEGVTHVVSLGFPSELEFYTHRAGRTGRMGKTGTCFALYKEEDTETVKKLSASGISFSCKDLKNGVWKSVKNPTVKRQMKLNNDEKAIVATLYRKNEKVKPNYKKKKNREVEKILRKKKREYIRSKIKEERIERYKQNARNRDK